MSIKEGLASIAGARVAKEAFRRQFSDMLLSGLVSKGYATECNGWLSITDAGRRALADD